MYKPFVVLNTMMALLAGTVVSAAISAAVRGGGVGSVSVGVTLAGKMEVHDVQHGALAGGITVGNPAIVMLSPAMAMFLGSMGAIVVVCSLRFLQPKISVRGASVSWSDVHAGLRHTGRSQHARSTWSVGGHHCARRFDFQHRLRVRVRRGGPSLTQAAWCRRG